MVRTFNTLVGRLAILQLAIYVVLLPLLFGRLDEMARAAAISLFTRHARAYADSLARELELGDVLESPVRTIVFLDGGVEGGGCLYAALEFNGRLFGSSVTETPVWIRRRGDDRLFWKSHDDTYAVSIPIRHATGNGTLYLGFDKRPTLRQLRLARKEIIEALAAFGAASLAAAVILARLISRPLMQLRAASRRVTSGELTAHLDTTSRMIEIVDLSKDLDAMRGELVGAAQSLRAEMRQRQLEQAERAVLENQLRHEQRLATIGTFAGGLAHEFNNILVPLILFTEESLDQIEERHPARESLERILKAASRAGSLVSRILALSRPVAERRPEPIDFAAIVNEALDLSRALIPSSIEVRREIEPGAKRVMAEPTLINQVVLNLCSNAVHAMRESGGTLTVRLESRAHCTRAGARSGSPMPVIALSVGDTGGGISPEIKERIFEPFFTTREVGEGSGLGLSVVHGIVASMGGTISVQSELGKGTQFTIELPVVAEALESSSA